MRKTTKRRRDPAAEAVAEPGGGVGSSILRNLGAAAGGAVAGFGWLPPHSPMLVVVGLAAVLYAGKRAGGPKGLATASFGGAIVYYAIANRPLVSAVSWGGWGADGGPTMGSPAWWLLNSLWMMLTVACSLFAIAAITLTARFAARRASLRIVLLATTWVAIAEWLRSVLLWRFEWGFLGLALAEVPALRQWSSVGGILLLSAGLVAASAVLVELATAESRRRLTIGAGALVAAPVVWLGGVALEPSVGPQAPEVRVAAFQFAPPVPPAGETTLGVSADWMAALPRVVERGYRLIVLPESISSHAVQLDGVPAAKLGADRQVSADSWRLALDPLLRDTDTFIALGVEGAEAGTTYNTTTLWNRDGLVGWQHKVRLVPFAEYLPAGWGFLGSQALTYYEAGDRFRPIAAGPLQIGAFICQEVQHSAAARELARRGANLLISGGNDGVFADRRVAQVHHSMARIRATEVGRFLVRAMKNGVTSIVSPSGETVGQSPSEDAALIGGTVSLRSASTLYARFGAWPLLVCAVVLLAVSRRSSAGDHGSPAR